MIVYQPRKLSNQGNEKVLIDKNQCETVLEGTGVMSALPTPVQKPKTAIWPESVTEVL